MALKDDVNFVLGAVARDTKYDERRCHLRIADGYITAYDGIIGLRTSTSEIGLTANPNAKELAHASKQVEEGSAALALNMTPGGKLAFKAGKFKAYINCLGDERDMTVPLPQGRSVPITADMLTAIKTVAPYIAKDNVKTWAQGVLLTKNYAMATNMVVAVQAWHGADLDVDVIIPPDAIKELSRIGTCPTSMQVNDNTATFWYGADRWLLTSLMEGVFPKDSLVRLFDKPSSPVAMNTEIFDAIKTLKPFQGDFDTIILFANCVATHRQSGVGATVEILTGVQEKQMVVFTGKYLASIAPICSKISWSEFPEPCHFFGPKLRGAIIGCNPRMPE